MASNHVSPEVMWTLMVKFVCTHYEAMHDMKLDRDLKNSSVGQTQVDYSDPLTCTEEDFFFGHDIPQTDSEFWGEAPSFNFEGAEV